MKVIFCHEFDLLKALSFGTIKNFGGIKTTTDDDIVELRKMGHQVSVNEPFPDGSSPDIIASSTFGFFTQGMVWKYKKKYPNAAVVQHAHTTAEDMKGGNFPIPESLAPAYIRQLYSYSHVLITPTEYSKKCLQHSGVKKPIFALSSGIHDEKLVGTPENRSRFREYLRQKYHVPEDMFVVANVGYTYLRKGIDRIYNVAKKMPNVFFIWPGQRVDNPYLSAGEKLPNMAFPGFYPDIRDVYYGADAFFFPSYVENLGLPIIEASMCKLPVITSRIEAFDWIPDKSHCIKGEKVSEYINGLKFLMENPKERKQMTDRAYNLAMDLHSFKKIGPRMVGVYEKAIQAKKFIDSKQKNQFYQKTN